MKGKHQEDWEADPVWNLVDQAEAPQAGPAFTQDVMRKVRQLEGEPARPWWKSLFAPVPLAAGALAAAAVLTFAIYFSPDPESSSVAKNGTSAQQGDAVASAIDEEVDQQLLIVAVEDPTLFSDEELLAMLY